MVEADGLQLRRWASNPSYPVRERQVAMFRTKAVKQFTLKRFRPPSAATPHLNLRLFDSVQLPEPFAPFVRSGAAYAKARQFSDSSAKIAGFATRLSEVDNVCSLGRQEMCSFGVEPLAYFGFGMLRLTSIREEQTSLPPGQADGVDAGRRWQVQPFRPQRVVRSRHQIAL